MKHLTEKDRFYIEKSLKAKKPVNDIVNIGLHFFLKDV